MRRALIVAMALMGHVIVAQMPASADHAIAPAGAGAISTAIARNASVVTGAGFVEGTAAMVNANAAPASR